MRPLVIWLAAVVVVFGGFAAYVTLARQTERVFVVVDSSFQMEAVWPEVRRELNRIDDQRFTEFALATEKSSIHSWSETLDLGGVPPFAPCDFDAVAGYPEVAEADSLILLTTSSNECDVSGFEEWTIIELGS